MVDVVVLVKYVISIVRYVERGMMMKPKYAKIILPKGKVMLVRQLRKCSECKQKPWCLLIDMHEYGHLKECSRS